MSDWMARRTGGGGGVKTLKKDNEIFWARNHNSESRPPFWIFSGGGGRVNDSRKRESRKQATLWIYAKYNAVGHYFLNKKWAKNGGN